MARQKATNSDMPASLTPKQSRAVAAILASPSLVEAARRTGVSARTLQRWLKGPEFATALREAGRQASDVAVQRLKGAALGAVAIAERLCHCGEPGVEARASLGILGLIVKLVAADDLIARVEALEARLLVGGNNGITRKSHFAARGINGAGEPRA
jgi:hypothetical protein